VEHPFTRSRDRYQFQRMRLPQDVKAAPIFCPLRGKILYPLFALARFYLLSGYAPLSFWVSDYAQPSPPGNPPPPHGSCPISGSDFFLQAAFSPLENVPFPLPFALFPIRPVFEYMLLQGTIFPPLHVPITIQFFAPFFEDSSPAGLSSDWKTPTANKMSFFLGARQFPAGLLPFPFETGLTKRFFLLIGVRPFEASP